MKKNDSLFGDMFDFNGDGELDEAESAAKLSYLESFDEDGTDDDTLGSDDTDADSSSSSDDDWGAEDWGVSAEYPPPGSTIPSRLCIINCEQL